MIDTIHTLFNLLLVSMLVGLIGALWWCLAVLVKEVVQSIRVWREAE
jgi:hypothetical protein